MNWMMGVPEALGGKLSVRRLLGAGAFGTVYEAIDTKFGGRVAVKVLARDQPQAIYRFKREFRSLADVIHPNLVRLYELVAADDALYFTMELVEGRDFLAHVTKEATRAAPTISVDLTSERMIAEGGRPPWPARKALAVDVAELRAAFLQLAGGVQAVHAAGKLHCDIKPPNVLVSNVGRVVLLDFGLVADLDGRDDRRRGAMGTPGYTAPEQAQGAALSSAADWYSVGAMLYEALTGALPRPGAARIEHAASDLADLAHSLLAETPSARPTGPDVLRRLGANTVAIGMHTRPRLFGRADELQTLRDAWSTAADGSPVLVRVVGNSGLGKTALVDTFLDELPRDQLVLRGKCYEQESVPYKALDTVVDALAEHLRSLGPAAAAVLPHHAALLGRLFPVLRDTLRPADDDVETLDSLEQRRRAFLALRELLARVANDKPIVCFLDDLQWGDVDSAHLLVELLRPPRAPRLLVIAAERPDVDAVFWTTFDATALALDTRTITVGELAERDAEALADHLLVTRTGTKARTIGREAAGNPLFIQQLAVRANENGDARPDVGLADVILARVDALDAAARQLVQMIALAGQPIEETVAVRAASLEAATSRDATLAVRHARLISARTAGDAIVLELAHDRVRETLVASLAPDVARGGHRRIAEALIQLSQPDPERLVHHFRSAGDDARTREFAVLAADRADEALAFERAASFRGLLLELTPEASDRWELFERHAQSLANAGRAIEAADEYERAANELEALGTDNGARVHAQRRLAGELTLRSGRLEHGAKRMERVLRDVGVAMPSSRRKASWLAMGRRLRLFIRGFQPRAGATNSAETRRRLDALWSAWSGITQMNHVVGDALGLQFLLEALASGDDSRILRGLGLESVFEAVIGGTLFRRRCDAMQDAMDRLAEKSGDPYDRAFSAQSRAGAAWFRGDWETCARRAAEAIQIYQAQCRGASWEIALCQAYRLPCIAYLGDLLELAEIVPRAYSAARERGDLFAANTLRLGQQSITLLVEDRPAEAIDEANAAIAPFPRDTYLGPHYHHLFAIAQAELFRDRPQTAWAAISAAWRDIERAKFLLAACLRVEIRHLRARAALATARVDRGHTRTLHALALRDAARIANDDIPAAAPIAAMIRAGVAATAGRSHAAAKELSFAIDGLERAKMALHVHAAKDRLGHLVGGSEGARLRETAASWMAQQGIKRPEGMIRMLVPGI